MLTSSRTVITVTSDGCGKTEFGSRDIDIEGSEQRMLSEQISAVNFRYRESHHHYASDWHVAGDPTLLLILSGTVNIVLRNGDVREFTQGDMFIAQDYLAEGIEFDDQLHGHRAEVVGDAPLKAIHIKLEKR